MVSKRASRAVAKAAVIVHLMFLGFVVLGGFVAWLMPWTLVPHAASAAWGASVIRWRKACPLSRMENWARRGAGRPPLPADGFVAHYFEDRVYPRSWARRVEVGVCGIVIASWIGFFLH
ncbi:MAG: DUF2784 domain-containing protein [Nocardioides sp.]|uniref:DUF2784 domain-containing protein n=1 Tax=Nocardioides sp. TaxID=35761 RepID=UPI0039E5E864